MADEMEEIINDFLTETEEVLDDLDQKFVELEQKGDDPDLLNEIFRAVHTIKGAAGFLGFQQIVDVSHQSESLMKRIREGELSMTRTIMDALLKAVDLLKILVGHVRAGDNVVEDLSGVLAALAEAPAAGETDAVEQTTEAAVETAPPVTVEEPPGEPEQQPAGQKKIGEVLVEQGVVGKDDVEDALEEQNRERKLGEILVEQKGVKKEHIDNALKEQSASGAPGTSAGSATLRVEVGRLDAVMNLVGEMVLARNRLVSLGSELENKYPDDGAIQALLENAAFVNLITTDLQLAVMKTRMQPVRKVFSKFPRIVRDLSRNLGKEAELILSGEETELDKSVIEELADPLVHLIRNAVDHGLEDPDERARAGKSPCGRIDLIARQEGNHIIIEVTDDGKGIDIEAIKAKAVANGIASEQEIQRLDEKQVLDFIFAPGFSTARQATEVSGRGVGMDVVKTNISRLNGFVEVNSEEGVGTRFKIVLPLTLAIIQSLMVDVGGETFALPLAPVDETIKIHPDEIKTVEGHPVVFIRERVIPVVDLRTVFGIEGNGGGMADGRDHYLVVISLAERKFSILVDRLIGKEEVVIKSLKGLNSETVGIAGATITGDGRVVLIVDLSVLLKNLAMVRAAA